MATKIAGKKDRAEEADLRSRAHALSDSGEHALAERAYRQLLSHGSDGWEIRYGLGRVLYRLGAVDEAVHLLRSSVEQGGGLLPSIGLATIIPAAPSASHEDILSTRIEAARILSRDRPITTSERPPNSWRAGNPLRVGFLSAYFHQPNYMKPVWGLLNALSRDELKLHLFSDAPRDTQWQGYLPRPQDQIHHTVDLDNRDLALLLRAQGLDALVDLNSYSVPQRLPLFLAPHAPVVLAWFNAFATTGLPGIDVIVGDSEVIREGEESHFSEDVRKLPGSYLTFQVSYPTPPISPPPCMESGNVTFGSLAPQYKITPPVLDSWAEILQRAPEARLFLANGTTRSSHNRAWILERFVERGIRTSRITFGDPAPHEEFLRHYASMDIALDTHPYSGGVTTMEALWQGVPVLSVSGDRWAGRTSRSLLKSAGMGEWVLENRGVMVRRAVELATDSATPGTLARIRTTLRTRLLASPVCDTRSAAEAFTGLLRSLLEDDGSLSWDRISESDNLVQR